VKGATINLSGFALAWGGIQLFPDELIGRVVSILGLVLLLLNTYLEWRRRNRPS